MSKKEKKSKKAKGKEEVQEQKVQDENQEAQAEAAENQNEEEEEATEEKANEPTVEDKLCEIQEKYIRLAAEFENYKKRTLRERMELIKSANEDVLLGLLPVMDDFERALQSMEESKDADSIKAGVDLIYNKFKEFMKQKGVKEIDAKEKDFDTDLHDALSKIPAPDKKLKGKVVDVIEKGYYLNDKVMRYAKVVIGD